MTGTMLAARLHERGKPLAVERVLVPTPGAGEVLVRVRACGLCGSDLHFLGGDAPVARLPITLGHEPAGTVETIGPGVTDLTEGLPVVIRPGDSCGVCPACAAGRANICEASHVLGMHVDGGLAEFVLARASDLVPIPAEVPFEQAAIVSDAVATPYHALFERGALQPGEAVAVFGCGGLGIHTVQLARLAGAGMIVAVDVRAPALTRARDAGADATVNAADERPARRIRELTGGVDLALECVGRTETIAEAVRSLRRGGRAVVVGMGSEPIALPPPNSFSWSEHALLGSFGSTLASVRRLLGMVAAGHLDLSSSVSEILPLVDVNRAIDLLRSPDRDASRVVIQPSA
ncbi:MAG: zinc-binding dehydrogenase [Dehalococcoidia bacterium]|nr:zinc-binding dehydrogenase [Dehalococcoidia bacterium]